MASILRKRDIIRVLHPAKPKFIGAGLLALVKVIRVYSPYGLLWNRRTDVRSYGILFTATTPSSPTRQHMSGQLRYYVLPVNYILTYILQVQDTRRYLHPTFSSANLLKVHFHSQGSQKQMENSFLV
jgi:hypothetical protein